MSPARQLQRPLLLHTQYIHNRTAVGPGQHDLVHPNNVGQSLSSTLALPPPATASPSPALQCPRCLDVVFIAAIPRESAEQPSVAAAEALSRCLGQFALAVVSVRLLAQQQQEQHSPQPDPETAKTTLWRQQGEEAAPSSQQSPSQTPQHRAGRWT